MNKIDMARRIFLAATSLNWLSPISFKMAIQLVQLGADEIFLSDSQYAALFYHDIDDPTIKRKIARDRRRLIGELDGKFIEVITGSATTTGNVPTRYRIKWDDLKPEAQ